MDWRKKLRLGVYSVPEAARLTNIHPQRVRRWVEGYSYPTASGAKKTAPVVKLESSRPGESTFLSFRDLMEVRFVDAYLERGVTWKTIRRAAEHAAEILQDDHPFSTRKFKTDGRSIFAELVSLTGERDLLDLAERQYVIFEVVNPALFESIEFGPDNVAARWFPLWPRKAVVVDPDRSFGQPVVESVGIPTYVLAQAAEAEGSVADAAHAYDVDPREVEAAVEFEGRRAA